MSSGGGSLLGKGPSPNSWMRLVNECVEYDQLQESLKFEEIARELTNVMGQCQRIKTIRNTYINIGDLIEANKVWFYFFNSILTPSKHVSNMRQDRAILLYALVKGCSLNVGKIVEQSIMDYAKNNFLGNMPHPALITLYALRGV